MRYGGYVLFAIPIFMFTSSYLSKFDLKMKRLLKISFSFIIISLLLFNIRNFVRINKEAEIYGYDLIKSPFFTLKRQSQRLYMRKIILKYIPQKMVNHVGHP